MHLVLTLSVIALVYMLFVVIHNVVRYCRADRTKKYKQLKSFRKGTFGLIYLGAIPLYLAGNLFNEINLFKAIFDSFSQALLLVALNFKWDVVTPLAQTFFFYKIAVYLCFAAAICNATMFTFSLFARRLRNRYLLRRIASGERDLCVLIGYHAAMQALLGSIDRKKYDLLLLCPESDEVKEQAFICDCATLPFSYSDSPLPLLRAYCGNTHVRNVRIIVNTEDDDKNFLIATVIGEYTKSLDIDNFSLDGRCGLSVYVFGSEQSESSYIRLSSATRGCIQCINPHKMVAQHFVEQHPITEGIKEEDIDPVTRTVRDELSLNFVLIGFGRMSRQLLRIHSINSQLLTLRGGVPAPKTIAYHVFDIAKTEYDINLNHGMLRYATWYKQKERGPEYPVPQTVFNIGYNHIDIGDTNFYTELRAKLTRGTERLSNSIVVAYGTDLANIDLAEKLHEKMLEWGLASCTKIYVRVRSSDLADRVVRSNYQSGEILPFGMEIDTIASAPYIISEGMEAMAKRQHLYYTRTDNDMSEKDAYQSAMHTWYDCWNQVQRSSNTYACLSVRMKLQLLGFDVAPLDDPRPDAAKEFCDAYFEGADPSKEAMRCYTEEELSDYTVRRHLMTRMEHLRWNAYMISCGYIPAGEQEYLTMSKQQLHEQRMHANIVNFEELLRYRRVIATQRNCSEADADVIKYDYRLTDNIPHLLAQSGQKIVRKE